MAPTSGPHSSDDGCPGITLARRPTRRWRHLTDAFLTVPPKKQVRAISAALCSDMCSSHAGDRRENEEQVRRDRHRHRYLHQMQSLGDKTHKLYMCVLSQTSLLTSQKKNIKLALGVLVKFFYFLFVWIICGTERKIWKRPKSRN